MKGSILQRAEERKGVTKMFSAIWKSCSVSVPRASCYTSVGGAVEMFKRLPHPVWHVHVLTLPCPLSQYILKDTYSVTVCCKALGILNCRQRVFVGFCFQFHAGLHFSFEGGFYSSNSHLASHVLVLFLWECNPPVANEHLFAWIRYERGVTVSIAERIISHSTHSKRQPEDGSGPRAHRRALRDPAANLPSLR